jgi:hypothetical protein
VGVKPKNIELNIEELVLHGFAPGDRYSIGEAVEQELTRLLAERGVPHSLERGGEVANMDGGAFEIAPDSRAQVVGAQVAKAVYRGLRQ